MKNQPLRKMAERTVCSAIFLCVCLSGILLSIPAAAQSTDGQPSLPPPKTLEQLHTALAELDPASLAEALSVDSARAESCTVSRGVACRALVWQHENARVVAHQWEFLDGEVNWRHLVVVADDDSEITATDWTWSSGVTVATDLRFESPGEPNLRVRKMVLQRDESTGEWQVQLYGLAWTTRSEGEEDEVTMMSASYAFFDGRQWRIDMIRVEGGGPGPWKVAGDAPALKGGILPPRVVHAGGDITELEAIAVNPMSGFAAGYAGYLRGTFDEWFGLGVGLVGEHEPSGRGLAFSHDLPLATLGAIWRPGARPALTAEGDAVFGQPLTHAAVALETPGYREAWRTQSIRRGAFFRAWSHSRAGAALHGDTHVLRFNAFDARTYRDQPIGRSGGASAGFGTEQSISDRAQVGLEVQHVSVGSSEQDRHVSSVRTDVMVDFGNTERAFARLGGLGRIETRLVPTEVGFGAGTSGGLYAAANAGFSFTGVFDRLRHRLRPSVFAVSEVVDFEKTASEAISDGGEAPVAVAVASQGPKPWHSAGVRLDQRLTGAGWSLLIPAEVFAASYGTPSSFGDTLGASAGLDASYVSADGTEFNATSHVVCERACGNVAWDVGARLDVGGWDAGYSLARANRLSQQIADLQVMQDMWSRILAFEVPASTLRLSQSATLGWERRRLRVDLTGVTNHTDWGVALEPRYAFEELGWSIGLTGFYDSFDREWGLLAGLSGR